MGLLQKMGAALTGGNKETEEMDDDETRDKFLRSLRRQRRTQLEEVEKKQLQEEIKEFEKERTKRDVFGFKTAEDRLEEKRNQLITQIRHKKQKMGLLKDSGMLKGGSMHGSSMFFNKKQKRQKGRKSL